MVEQHYVTSLFRFKVLCGPAFVNDFLNTSSAGSWASTVGGVVQRSRDGLSAQLFRGDMDFTGAVHHSHRDVSISRILWPEAATTWCEAEVGQSLLCLLYEQHELDAEGLFFLLQILFFLCFLGLKLANNLRFAQRWLKLDIQ